MKATTIGSNSYYNRFVVKSVVTSCIKAVIGRSKSNHIRSKITTIATSDNKVEVTRAYNNLLINNCTIVNRGIKKKNTKLYI